MRFHDTSASDCPSRLANTLSGLRKLSELKRMPFFRKNPHVITMAASPVVGSRGQPLTVVAVGLILHIYRRASFTHRATP